MKGKHYPPEFGAKVSAAKKGKPHAALSDEARNKISAAHKGKKISEWHKERLRHAQLGHIPWNKGLKDCHSKETLAKIRLFKSGHIPFSKGKTRADDPRICGGDRHYNWHGGKNGEKYPQRWNHYFKESIRNRDGYLCQVCGKKQNGKALVIHHIDGNKNNITKENLISLCAPCHTKGHRGTLTTQTAKALFIGY